MHNRHTDDMTLELCHCAFEAGHKPMTDKVIYFIHPYVPAPQNAHDCAAVLYILGNINNNNNLEIQFQSCANSKVVTKLADILANKHGNV